jgi:hypothetical protein
VGRPPVSGRARRWRTRAHGSYGIRGALVAPEADRSRSAPAGPVRAGRAGSAGKGPSSASRRSRTAVRVRFRAQASRHPDPGGRVHTAAPCRSRSSASVFIPVPGSRPRRPSAVCTSPGPAPATPASRPRDASPRPSPSALRRRIHLPPPPSRPGRSRRRRPAGPRLPSRPLADYAGCPHKCAESRRSGCPAPRRGARLFAHS